MAIYDEINYWSEIKIDIVKRYAAEYSRILTNQRGLHHIYIDAFSGSGRHYSKTKRAFVLGSPLEAARLNPPFKEYFFIDIDKEKMSALQNNFHERRDIHILGGDCNTLLLQEVFPYIQSEKSRRGLCLLDPYSIDLTWEVVVRAGHMKTIEIFVNFPAMDINRNVLLKKPQNVRDSDIRRMNIFWGDNTWQNIAYDEVFDLFGEQRKKKRPITEMVYAYKKRLENMAGFAHVSAPLPMRNTRRGIVYFLLFASQKPVADRIVTYIFNKYRNY